jgi:hypothetical protein
MFLAKDVRSFLLPEIQVTVPLPPPLIFDIDIFNCNWVDIRWQYYSTHLHTNKTQHNTKKQNTQNVTYIAIRIHNLQN